LPERDAITSGEEFTMPMLLAGLILFFLPHSVAVVAPRWRDRVVMHLGAGRWKSTYSLFSAAGLILMVLGFAHARRSPLLLYVSPPWLHDVTWLMMLPVFPLLFAAYLPGRIQTAMKHPMLAAIKLWATAHLLVNGTLADLLLFGSFLIWAIVVRISLKRRVAARVPGVPPSRFNDLIAIVLGLGLYALFIGYLHGLITGIPLLGPAGTR
jgi:uncharacterized membrane protein